MPLNDWNYPENITDQRLRLSAAFFLTRIKHRYNTINYSAVAQEVCAYLSDKNDPDKVIGIRAMHPILGGIGTNRGMVLRDSLLCWAAATDPTLLPNTADKNHILEKRKKAWLQVAVETQRDGNFFSTLDVDADGEKFLEDEEFWAGDDEENVDKVACDAGIKSKYNFVFKEFHPDARVDYDLDLYNLIKGFILRHIAHTNDVAIVLNDAIQLSTLLSKEAISLIKQDLIELFSVHGECVLSDKELLSIDDIFGQDGLNYISFTKQVSADKNGVKLTAEDLSALEILAQQKLSIYSQENCQSNTAKKFSVFEPETIKAIFATLKNESAVQTARMLRLDLETILADAQLGEPLTTEVERELLFLFRDRRTTPAPTPPPATNYLSRIFSPHSSRNISFSSPQSAVADIPLPSKFIPIPTSAPDAISRAGVFRIQGI